MNSHKLGCPLIDEYNPNNLDCTCSQPSSIPVELPPMYYGNEKHPDIESIRKAHPEAFDTSKNYETSPSTPEVSWKPEFRVRFSKHVRLDGAWYEWRVQEINSEIIEDFIKNIEQKAYDRGVESERNRLAIKTDKELRRILAIELPKFEQETLLIESKRVNDILEGMKKEGDDFQCFDTDCFGNRTPTVIEKRLSSQDESYNLALEQAKHLINNTQ